ncbi:hypothetical protein FDP41_013428 [Naegleria fowleri]|uniref:Uncharacterized protein n=1 Tax=Naegleria fowleri TaxID=5763 RepID=A0A6A5C0V6_NAEFO|nr:uncharacterized protein FDP41_013428 [Naegleria fowleri]KAF0980214.1 hypothetical protein FDP41_013428 [Naegleria fowleri]
MSSLTIIQKALLELNNFAKKSDEGQQEMLNVLQEQQRKSDEHQQVMLNVLRELLEEINGGTTSITSLPYKSHPSGCWWKLFAIDGQVYALEKGQDFRLGMDMSSSSRRNP